MAKRQSILANKLQVTLQKATFRYVNSEFRVPSVQRVLRAVYRRWNIQGMKKVLNYI